MHLITARQIERTVLLSDGNIWREVHSRKKLIGQKITLKLMIHFFKLQSGDFFPECCDIKYSFQLLCNHGHQNGINIVLTINLENYTFLFVF